MILIDLDKAYCMSFKCGKSPFLVSVQYCIVIRGHRRIEIVFVNTSVHYIIGFIRNHVMDNPTVRFGRGSLHT